jgi:ATP-binding cassette, subfamily F, member 3
MIVSLLQLEEALQHFDGAVLVVSHDRYFISQVANTIATLEDGVLKRYEGDYRYYMEQNAQLMDKVCTTTILTANHYC